MIKVNVAFEVNEKDPQSMSVLSKFFAMFDQEEMKINQKIETVSPFEETEDGSVPQSQIDGIVEHMQKTVSDNISKPAKIDGYVRRITEEISKKHRLSLFNKDERKDPDVCMRILANEALVGGLEIVGIFCVHGESFQAFVKDCSGTFRIPAFGRWENGSLMKRSEANDRIKKYMVELGCGVKHHSDFNSTSGTRSDVALPTDNLTC